MKSINTFYIINGIHSDISISDPEKYCGRWCMDTRNNVRGVGGGLTQGEK